MFIYVGSLGKGGSAELGHGDQEQGGDTDEEIGNLLLFLISAYFTLLFVDQTLL